MSMISLDSDMPPSASHNGSVSSFPHFDTNDNNHHVMLNDIELLAPAQTLEEILNELRPVWLNLVSFKLRI